MAKNNRSALKNFEELFDILGKDIHSLKRLTSDLEDARRNLLEKHKEMNALNENLLASEEEIRATNEELEATSEELRATNEELEAASEELRATNEKLEATSEEVRATNEELKSANEDLFNTKSDLENLLMSIDEMILVVDPQFHILRANKTAQRWLGVKNEEEAFGRKCHVIFQKKKSVCPDCPVAEAIKTKKPVYAEKEDRLRKRFLSINASPVLDSKGKVLKVIEVTRDISARVEAEEKLKVEKAYLDELIESAQEAIVISDNNHNIIRINSEFTRMFGYPLEEALGRQLDGLVAPPEFLEEANSFTKEVSSGEKVSFESLRGGKDGRLFHASVLGAPIKVGDEHLGYYFIYRDISQRKKTEEELKRRAAQTALLYSVGQKVSGTLDLEELLSKIVTAVRDAFNYNGVMLMLADEESRRLTLQAIAGGYADIFPKDMTRAFGEGMTGYAALSGRTQVSGDVRSDPHYIREADERTKSEIAVPIKRGRKVIGVLDIQSNERDAFDETDVAAMETLSTQIASAIEHARLYKQAQVEIKERKQAEELIKKRNKQLELIHKIQNEIPMSADVETILSASAEIIARSFGHSKISVNLFDKESNEVVYLTGWNELGTPTPRGHRQKLGVGMIGTAAKMKKMIVANDVTKEPSYIVYYQSSTKSEATIPLFVQNNLVGILDIQDTKKNAFTNEEVSILQSITNYLAYVIDEKQKQEAIQKEAAKLSAMISGMEEGVVFADNCAQVIEVNDYFLKLIRKKKHEILGKTLWDFHIGPPLQIIRGHIDHFKKNPHSSPVVLQRALFGLETILRFQPIYRNGCYEGVILNLIDVTELVVARKEALLANRAKSEFLANVSHEIRTPMNGVIGLTELVLGTNLSEDQKEYIDGIKDSAQALMTIINDILDFSKIEARKIELESIAFNLRDSVVDSVSSLSLQAHKKRLELACEIDRGITEVVIGDPGRLRQILVNLVSNAIKFTDKGEILVSVSLESKTETEAKFHFKIKDTGTGIPKAKQRLIFEAFSQADGSTTRKYGGTGLGLAISSQLAEIMGGKLWVESKLGKGSVFHFTIRFQLPAEPQPEPELPTLEDLRSLPVLVVDDNATNRRILKDMLLSWQMEPIVVEGGKKALAAMEKAKNSDRQFALVLIDSHMPVMDGFTLAEKIKQDPMLAKSSIIMLTSGGYRGDGARCREIGISAYLTKPIKQSELLDAITQSFGYSSGKADVVPLITKHSLRESHRAFRILLAEDNVINQKVAACILEKNGYTVEIANDGREAISALEKAAFDVILMDVQMPRIDGFKATSLIRKREKGTGVHIPIIAMTAHAMKGDQERCLKAGMDDYLAKPLNTEDLLEKVGKYISLKSQK